MKTSLLKFSQFRRTFFGTSSASQDPQHRLYSQVDWDRVRNGYYAIVDPLDESGILYLTQKEYVVNMRVFLSAEIRPVVLARPGDVRVGTGSGSTSPTSPLFGSKSRKPITRDWYNSTGSVYRGFKWARGVTMVSLSESNLREFVERWAFKVYLSAMGALPSVGFRRSLSSFVGHLFSRFQHQGARGVVLLLKTSLFYINSALIGNPIKNPWHLGYPVKVDKFGFPIWLPHSTRVLLRQNNVPAIRAWASLLNIFKGIAVPAKPNLASIESPMPDISGDTFARFGSFGFLFWDWVASRGGRLSLNLTAKPFPIYSAGPEGVSLLTAVRSAYAWSRINPSLIREWFNLCPANEDLRGLWADLAARYRFELAPFGKGTPSEVLEKQALTNGPLRLGKLALKLEPAGKVRVFAIVDWWTQILLRPVHDWMFKILKVIPADATFDQEASLRSFLDEPGEEVYSFDLSSATDMIPRPLYQELFSTVWGHKTAGLWLRMLVERDFIHFPDPSDKSVWRVVRYTRGQPMGALSSWASLAILHHALVLFSAHEVGRGLDYQAYRVLGDDVVIRGKDVADKYLEVCAAFSIPVGLPKSYTSPCGGFNFANQTYAGGENISPWSVREELAIRGPTSRLEMVFRAVRRGWIGTLADRGFISSLLRLALSVSSYRKVQQEMTKGRLGVLGALTLSLCFLPIPSRMRELGMESSSLGVPSLIKISDTGFLGLGPSLALGQCGKEWEIALPMAHAMIRKMLSDCQRVIADGQKAMRAYMDWLETQSPTEISFLRVVLSKSLYETRDTNFKVAEELRKLLDDLETWTPIDLYLPLTEEFTARYWEALELTKKVSAIPNFRLKDPFDPELRARDKAVVNLYRYQDLVSELGFEVHLQRGHVDLEILGRHTPGEFLA